MTAAFDWTLLWEAWAVWIVLCIAVGIVLLGGYFAFEERRRRHLGPPSSREDAVTKSYVDGR